MKIQQFFIHFEYGGQENIFLEGEKSFLVLFFKGLTKSKCQQQKKLVFSFSFWFQFIQ